MRLGKSLSVVGCAGLLWAFVALAQSPGPPLGAPPLADAAVLDFPPLTGSVTLAEAVRRALSANTNVVVQGLQVQMEAGNVQQAVGAYDLEGTASIGRESGSRPLRQVDVATIAAANMTERRADYSNSGEYKAGATQTLRSGLALEATATVNTSASTLNTANAIPKQTTASLRFGVRVPLLRNAGGIQLSSALAAREAERDASVEDLVHTSASTVLAVAQAYWELAARRLRVDIMRASEKRAEGLVADIARLVAVDHIPGAELDLAQASAGEKRAVRIAEEQALQVAWNALGQQLQADTADDVLTTELRMDALPEISEAALNFALRMQQRRKDAAERRADVRAARLRERSAYLQLQAAEDGVKPQVDFVAALTTHGLAESTSTPAFELSRVYPAVFVGVEMRMPLQNNVARGLHATRLSAHSQALARVHGAESNVGPALVTAVNSLRRILFRYKDSAAAAERYDQAVKNEYTKRKLGLSTLIDVINVQDRLDSAQLQLLQLRQEYAVGLAQILFESGDLVGREAGDFRVDLATLGGANLAGGR